MVRKLVFGAVFIFIGQSPILAQETIAKLLVDKGLSRINVEARETVTTDLLSVAEEYTDKEAYDNKRVKSTKTSRKTITGRPKLGYLNIDELYQAFATRFDFIIDNNDSTRVVNDILSALIKFTPKPNLTSKTVTDAFINHTAGKVYIDLDNYEIVRVEGSINNHFVTTWRAWWSPISFSVDVYEFNFSIDYTVFNNMVIEKDLDGMADYEIRHRGIDRRTYTLSNYRIQR